MVATEGLIEAAEATGNPFLLSFALHAYGIAFGDADPLRALDALDRGLVIAQDSNIRFIESQLATHSARLEALHGDSASAFDHLALAIRNYHDSGSPLIRIPLAALAAFFDRLGRQEPAATLAGFAFGPLTAMTAPEIETAITHLRDVLGDQTLRIARPQG